MTRVPPAVSEAAVACSLSPADLTTRQRRWLLLGERTHIDTVLTGNGLRLSFQNEPATERELTELTDLEQDCCAFARWSLHSHGNTLVLDVTAHSAEGIAAVQAMFRTLQPAPPQSQITSHARASSDQRVAQPRSAASERHGPNRRNTRGAI